MIDRIRNVIGWVVTIGFVLIVGYLVQVFNTWQP